MEYWPEDVLIPLFSKLPAKSVMRFKCLSKSWSLVFSDPKFTRNHLKSMNLNDNHKDFILEYFTVDPLFSRVRIDTSLDCCEGSQLKAQDMESPLETSDVIMTTACCDGILCTFTVNNDVNVRNSVVLWNPMTREHKRFSPINLDGWWNAYGFGYDSVIDDYKVIHIRGIKPQYQDIQCLSLKVGRWKVVLNNVPYCFSIYINNNTARAVNGCLYWIAEKNDDFGNNICHVILCFNLEKETISEETALCGEGVFYQDYESTLVEYGESLVLLGNSLCLVRGYDGVHSELFLMEENQVAKTKHWIRFMRIVRTAPELLRTANPIFVIKSGQVLTNEHSGSGLFLFKLDGLVKKIAIDGHRSPPSCFFVIPYVESLISLAT